MTDEQKLSPEPQEPKPHDFRVALAKGLLSSVPVAGPIAVEFVNAEIQKREAENLEMFQRAVFDLVSTQDRRIEEIEEQVKPKDWIRAAKSNERWKPRAFANILLSDPGDSSDLTKQIMAEHVEVLNNYDVWLLMQLTNETGRKTIIDPSIRKSVAEMETSDPNIEHIRASSLEKLEQLRLVTKEGETSPHELTPLGEKISFFVR